MPPDRVRMHVCWGNYEGPHHYDVPLEDIIDIVFAARPSGVSFEAANPRHAHEWRLFERVKLPEGKILIPGVLESKTNYIEHPELVAQRIGRYAKLVGRENVIGGTDCGYGTWVGQAAVDPGVVWAKLAEPRRGRAARFPGVLAVASARPVPSAQRDGAATSFRMSCRASMPTGLPFRTTGTCLRLRASMRCTTAPISSDSSAV